MQTVCQSTLILLIVLVAAFISFAQSTSEGEIENWTNFKIVCAEASRTLIEVEVAPSITLLSLYPDRTDTFFWYPSEAATIRHFWLSSENTSISIHAEVGTSGSYFVGAFLLESSTDCALIDLPPAAEPSIPMNECLGVTLEDLLTLTNYSPQSQEFVVDGFAYAFTDNLSFLVPEDAVWTWDLYIDGRHLFRFEQSAETPCYITAIYPQIS